MSCVDSYRSRYRIVLNTSVTPREDFDTSIVWLDSNIRSVCLAGGLSASMLRNFHLLPSLLLLLEAIQIDKAALQDAAFAARHLVDDQLAQSTSADFVYVDDVDSRL